MLQSHKLRAENSERIYLLGRCSIVLPKKIKLAPYALKLRNIQRYLYKNVLCTQEISQLNFINTFFPGIVLTEVGKNEECYDIESKSLNVSKTKRGYTSGTNIQINEICGSLFGKNIPEAYKQITPAEEVQKRVAQDLISNSEHIEKMRKTVEMLFLNFSAECYENFEKVFSSYIQNLPTFGRIFNQNDHTDFIIPDLCYQELIVRITTQWNRQDNTGRVNSFLWLLIGSFLGPKVDVLLTEYNSDFTKRIIVLDINDSLKNPISFTNIDKMDENKIMSEYYDLNEELINKFNELFDLYTSSDNRKSESQLINRMEKIKVRNFSCDFFKAQEDFAKEYKPMCEYKKYQRPNLLRTYSFEKESKISGNGKHFSICNPVDVYTIVFEVYKIINMKNYTKYFDVELLKSTDQKREDGRILTTFYVEDPTEHGNQLILFHFKQDKHGNNDMYINNGLLIDDEVKLSKEPSCMPFLYIKSNAYEWEWVDMTPRIAYPNPVMIDLETYTILKPELYYNEEEDKVKGRVRIKRDMSYISFQVRSAEMERALIPLTDLEIGKNYITGNGYGGKVDLYKAAQYLEKDGSPEAFYEIAHIFLDYHDFYDEESALMYLRESADKGYKPAKFEIAVYPNINCTPTEKEISILTEVGNKNYGPAQLLMGYIYEKAWSIDDNLRSSFEWYYKAACDNFLPARYRFENEWSDRKNEKEELYNTFVKSVKSGMGVADFCLGACFLHGFDIKANEIIGESCLRKAIEEGNTSAAYELVDYFETKGDYNKTKFYLHVLLKDSNIQKDVSFLIDLSNCLIDTAIDNENDDFYELAFITLEIAARNGDGTAINNLGWLFENGYGCEKDYSKALHCFEKASSMGKRKPSLF